MINHRDNEHDNSMIMHMVVINIMIVRNRPLSYAYQYCGSDYDTINHDHGD